jgi:ElaB/YqjD/DUF883 family membrane-anchored ribosome-binding protein
MPNENRTPATTVADNADAAGEALTDMAGKTRDAMSTMARTAADRLSNTRATTADGLATAASALRTGADSLPGGERVSELAHSAVDRVSVTADYVRRNDVNRMMADVETMVKNNPGLSLLIAAAFGFLLGRAVARD